MKVSAETVLSHGLRIVIIILLALLASWLVRRALARIARRLREKTGEGVGPRAATLVEMTASLAKYAIFFVAALMVLMEAGVNPTPVIAGAGIVGLAVGFGAQSLVRDVVSGFFVLLEGQYGIGDVVEINGVLGTVQEVGLRMTRLRDSRGQMHFFPNGSVSSVNRFPSQGLAYTLQVPHREGQEEVREVIEQILADFNQEYEAFVSPPSFLGTKALSAFPPFLLYELSLRPLRHALAMEKLPGRLASGLQRAGRPLPEGSEISFLPILPRGAE